MCYLHVQSNKKSSRHKNPSGTLKKVIQGSLSLAHHSPLRHQHQHVMDDVGSCSRGAPGRCVSGHDFRSEQWPSRVPTLPGGCRLRETRGLSKRNACSSRACRAKTRP
jgi:hypothetical protein